MMVARAVFVLVIVGCYSPHPQGGTCEKTTECPPGIACVGGVCGGDPALDARRPDADPTCACAGNSLTCSSGSVACALGCKDGVPARCARLIPSNHVTGALVDDVTVAIEISGATFLNTDTGELSGSLIRAAGEGVIADIEYQQHATYAVFVFASLTIDDMGSRRRC